MKPAILFVDSDVIVRGAVAAYLRECGYDVVEAGSDDDAKLVIESDRYDVDIAICSSTAAGTEQAFSLVRWIRKEHPRIRVLMAATVDRTMKLASEVCAEGPHLRKPYERDALLDWVKRLRH